MNRPKHLSRWISEGPHDIMKGTKVWISEAAKGERMQIKRFSERVVLFSIAVAALETVAVSIELDGNALSGPDFFVARAAVCLLGAYLIRVLGLWRGVGVQRDGFARGLLLGVPLVALGLLSGIVSNAGAMRGASFLGVSKLLAFTAAMLFVGLAEEMIYRGLLLNLMLRKWGSDARGVWKAVFVSAAIFGGAHLTNLFFASALTVIVQAVNAAAGGVLFCAIYIKTKNLLAVIAVHALVDWLALFLQVCFGGTSVIAAEMAIGQVALVIAAGSLPPLFFAWLYLGNTKKVSRTTEF